LEGFESPTSRPPIQHADHYTS